MSARCASPLAWEVLVDYWSGELDEPETDRVDEHLMACDVCSAASARVGAVRDAIRASIPPFLSRQRVEALRARGLRIVENPVREGERVPAIFRADVDILLHRLGGLELRQAESARVTVIQEETGQVLIDRMLVPFERESGEILVACQRHFGAFGRTVVFEVQARAQSGAEHVARYAIPHVFED